MKNKTTKITGANLFSLTSGCVVGGTIIIIASLISLIAKQDAWIVALIAPFLGLPVIWMYCYLGKQYPSLSWIGICKKIFGRRAGFVVALGYTLLFIMTSYQVAWFVGDFEGHIMNETPHYALLLIFISAVVIAILYGIEAFGRATVLYMILVSVLFFINMLMVLPDIQINNLLPVLENGIAPILKSLVFILSFTTLPIIIIMMVYPQNAANLQKAQKSILGGYLWGNMIVFISILMSILVMGSAVTASSEYPTYLLAQQINIGTIFTRLEFMMSTIWLVTEFIIAVLFFNAAIRSLSELLNLKDYKKIVIPYGLVIFLLSDQAVPDTIAEGSFDSLVWPPLIITFGLVIPVIMLIVFFIKKWLIKKI